MEITSTHKGQTVKTVTFAGVGIATEDDLRNAAMAAMGETRSSLFGTNVRVSPDWDTATVELYTD